MKKFRLISSLLAALMVFSMLTAMPVGAVEYATPMLSCDFESFPLANGTTTPSTVETFSKAGFTVTGADYAVIDEDSANGNALGQVKNTNFKLEKKLDSPLTKGQVKIRFSYKMSAGGFAQLGCYTASNTVKMMMNLSSGGIVMSGPTNGKILVSSTNNAGKWYSVELVVDLDNHMWTVYVDGAEKGSWSTEDDANLSTTLTAFYGFQFYNNASRSNTDARIDNLRMVYEAEPEKMAETISFDNMTIEKSVTQNAAGTITYGATRYLPAMSEYKNIFQYATNTPTVYDVARVKHKDLTFAEGESRTDYALGATVAADYWIGWPIDGDTGIEVYEFDCYYKHPSASTANSVCVQLTSGPTGKSGEFFKLPSKSSWQHIKIEYNTKTDELTAYVDGVLTGNTISASSFQNLLRLNQPENTTTRADVVLAIDNYISYVKPLVYNLELTMNGNEVESEGTTGENGDTVEVTADIINTSSGYDKITVIYALYNGDELVDAKSADIDVDADSEHISHTFTTEAKVSYDTVKAFIWDGLTTRTPLTVAASYPR